LLAIEGDTVWHPDVTYVAARSRGLDGLHHRFLRANTLQYPWASALRLRLIGLFGTLGWFSVRIFVVGDGHQMPAAVALLAWPAVALLVRLSIQRSSVRGEQWPRFDVYAITASALPISWLFGVLIVAVSSRLPIVDLVGHLLFGLAALFALRAVHKTCRPDLVTSVSGH
jgi:hypothetical protein